MSLKPEQIEIYNAYRRKCGRDILKMVSAAQSGHPGGSLSALDCLLALYLFEITETNAKVVVSNGHISPAVYSILGNLGIHDIEEMITTFRQAGSVYEGHVTRHVRGVDFGTGPLGVGVSAAAGMAMAAKLKNPEKPSMVWSMVGDGECQEGQVHEMMLFANAKKLSNLAVFVDGNDVQLTDSLEKIMPTPITGLFRAAGWNVLAIDGHDVEEIHQAMQNAKASDKPTLIFAKTVMGKGLKGLEEDGMAQKSTWHGKSPKPEQTEEILKNNELLPDDEVIIKTHNKSHNWNPKANHYPEIGKKMDIKTGNPKVYDAETLTDCRSAYGAALLDLAEANDNVVGLSADLMGSVKTNMLDKAMPEKHIECGICEQNMVSVSGGMAVSGLVPFCSTFGAFMSSRAKDQARVNDINHANVKMVSTHCGLSVGEDGPTHQAIDDMGSFLGMFGTRIFEPADPNHCDRLVRYAAGTYGQVYIRMGRHKLKTLTKSDGTLLFDENYEYEYGKTEVYKEGNAITVIASGAMVHEAIEAVEQSGIDAEIIIASSPKQFDENLEKSLQKTGKYLTVEDHNPYSGLGAGVNSLVLQKGLNAKLVANLGVTSYQLSGKPKELYKKAGCGVQAIIEKLQEA